MAIVKEHCGSCGSIIDVNVAQSTRGYELVWYRAYACPNCGANIEEDGKGDTPDDIRNEILKEEGKWALMLQAFDADITVALKLLRHILGLSLAEVRLLRKKLPGVVFEGTKPEVDRLMKLMKEDGLHVSVSLVE